MTYCAVYRLMVGSGMMDAVFVVRRLWERWAVGEVPGEGWRHVGWLLLIWRGRLMGCLGGWFGGCWDVWVWMNGWCQ